MGVGFGGFALPQEKQILKIKTLRTIDLFTFDELLLTS